MAVLQLDVSVGASIFVLENAQLLDGVVHKILVDISCLRFLFQLFKHILQFLVFVLQVVDQRLVVWILIYQIWNLSLVFWHEKLLWLYFLTELFFNAFGSVFVENQCSQDFFVLEIFLLVILQQVLLAVQVIFESLDLLKILLFDALVSMSLVSFNLLIDQHETMQILLILF